VVLCDATIDTSTAAGKCLLDMLGVFAEFETNLRKERQLEGIAKNEGCRCVQGPAGVDRCGSGSKDESGRTGGVGLSRAGVARPAGPGPDLTRIRRVFGGLAPMRRMG
jgi:hypothetical protein